MKGMNLNVDRRFVTGQFQQGRNVDTTRPDRLGLFVRTPRTLALFNHTHQNHLSTGVTQTQFNTLVQLDRQEHPVFNLNHRTHAELILQTAGVLIQNMNTAQKVKAAVMLGSGEVSGAWMRDNINHVVGNDQRDIAVGKMLQSAYLFAHEQQRGGLQDPSASFNTKLALDVADKVLAPNGTVDRDMVATLIDQLSNDRMGTRLKVGPHRAEMIKLLTHIRDNGAFRNTLAGITAPAGNSAQAKTIRATLNKPTGVLSNRDARKAVLSSMLAHLRQGSVGSCFGTSIAIHLKTNHYNKTLTMLKDLVENNRLQGTYVRGPQVNPVVFDLPGNHNALDLQFNHTMKFSSSGTVTQVNRRNLPESVKLYDIPGVIQGLNAVGITNRQAQIEAVTAAAGRMAGLISDARNSPKQLLANIIDNTQTIENKGLAKRKAGFAFHATMENRLMRSLEYTLSGFAETRHAQTLGSKLMMQIDNLYMTVNFGENDDRPFPLHVNDTVAKVDNLDRDNYQAFLGQFTTRFSQTMNTALAYKYDPELVHGQLSGDGHSSHGGFTITFKHPVSNETKTLKTPADLADAVKTLFQHQAAQDMIAINDANWTNGNLVTVTHATLMTEIFDKVNTQQLGANLIARTADLQGNPVGFTQGADPGKVVRMLFGNSAPVTKGTLAANPNNNGKSVLTHVLTTLRTMQARVSDEENDYSVRTLRDMSIPISSKTHAFLLKPGLDPFLTTQMSRDDNISDVLDARLKPEALTNYADQALNRQAVISFVDRLSTGLGMDKNTVKQALRNQQHSLKPNDVYNTLVAGLPDDGKRAGRAEALAFALAKTFEAPTRAVMFADTNWGNGDEDVHFGVVHNPFSNTSELWSFSYDGETHTPRSIPNQRTFVQGSWDIFREPKEYGF